MKQKILAGFIVLATAVVVWAVTTADKPEQGTIEEEQMVESFLAGEVTEVNGSRIKFAIGQQVFMTRVTEDTQITKTTVIVGKPTDSGGSLEDIKKGTHIEVYYNIPKDRGVGEPLAEVDATRIKVTVR